VTRLLDAGVQIVAVLNMDNFAFAAAGNTSAYGPTLNPHKPQHLAGGSSGGSAAALYYEDIDLTLGGDQAGSIRIPAAWCGVVGLKPMYSLVPYTGIVSLDPTLDHAGPMARSVVDVVQVLEVLAGKDPGDPRQYDVPVHSYRAALRRDLRGVRIGILQEGMAGSHILAKSWRYKFKECIVHSLEQKLSSRHRYARLMQHRQQGRCRR
jgi:amidase